VVNIPGTLDSPVVHTTESQIPCDEYMGSLILGVFRPSITTGSQRKKDLGVKTPQWINHRESQFPDVFALVAFL
jgi:hypothetical protein